jgi:hypothetical protein
VKYYVWLNIGEDSFQCKRISNIGIVKAGVLGNAPTVAPSANQQMDLRLFRYQSTR